MDPTYTVITAHFGDLFWIRQMARRVDRLSDDRVAEIIVVNQDRRPQPAIHELPRVSGVLEFPVDNAQVERLGHDHPAALDRALRSVTFSTSHVIVMDSDCFPIRAEWLDQIDDVTLAGDPEKWGLTHPCFMAFPVDAIGEVDFSAGLLEVGLDTGRLVGLQLARTGLPVLIDKPVRGFNGLAGWTYLDGAIYHHGSGSFASASSPWMTQQVDARRERWLRSKITEDQFTLTRWQAAQLALMKAAGQARRSLHGTGQ